VGRYLKRVFRLGLLAGAVYAVWRWFEAQRTQSDLTGEAQPAPYPPEPRADSAVHIPSQVTPPGGPEIAGGGAAWVEPVGDTCPSSHPVKAKMTSRIFHLAGGRNYARTRPERCYRDADAAEADGLRRAAR
jgi:hypothetical protein